MDIKIIDNRKDFIVCIKPAGITSEETGMVRALRELLGCEILPVHRLDKPAGGLMVYAKSKKAAAALSESIRDGSFRKVYLACVPDMELQDSGVFEDLLFHDSSKNRSYAVKRMRKGVRQCRLSYAVTGRKNGLALVKILLDTGRTHQIRAQFASRGMPLEGDRRYGSRSDCPLALYSCEISFPDPSGEGTVTYTSAPSGPPFDLFGPIEDTST